MLILLLLFKAINVPEALDQPTVNSKMVRWRKKLPEKKVDGAGP